MMDECGTEVLAFSTDFILKKKLPSAFELMKGNDVVRNQIVYHNMRIGTRVVLKKTGQLATITREPRNLSDNWLYARLDDDPDGPEIPVNSTRVDLLDWDKVNPDVNFETVSERLRRSKRKTRDTWAPFMTFISTAKYTADV